MSQKTLRIATRKSPLALWQANHVREQLMQHWPALEIECVPMTTTGDMFLQSKLSAIGSKGLFVKELEEALLDHRADLAVHSMKDVPSVFPKGLELAAICSRDNPLDALLSCKYTDLDHLPAGASVGTTSLRRQSQLLAVRPDLRIKALRGNIQTRIAKLQGDEYDAIVLAAAGLERMSMQEHIREVLSTEVMLPACGQGALGIECRTDDEQTKKYIRPLNDSQTALCVHAERQVSALLGGSCHVPLAVYCLSTGKTQLLIRAKVASIDGKIVVSHSAQGCEKEALLLAHQCANALLANGADTLLHRTPS
jgi:hydroxymethylbilane synthase